MSTLGEYLLSPDAERLEPALIPHGGGMSGAYSAGALATLLERDLLGGFKHLIANSSGAINGVYALSGHSAHDGLSIYTEAISNRRFVNIFRVTKIVDIDYLVDEVLRQRLPIDVARLQEASTKLHILLTNAKSGEQEAITDFNDETDIYEVLRATAALPGLYNRKVVIKDREYVDGGVSNYYPVDYAIGLGAKAILGIVTWPEGYRRMNKGVIHRSASLLLSRGQSNVIKAKIGAEDRRFNDVLDMVEGVTPSADTKFWTVRPSSPAALAQRRTIDKRILHATIDMGRRDMENFLDQKL